MKYYSQPRPAPSEPAPDRPEVAEFNNTRPTPGFNLYNDIQVTRWDGLLANYDINIR